MMRRLVTGASGLVFLHVLFVVGCGSLPATGRTSEVAVGAASGDEPARHVSARSRLEELPAGAEMLEPPPGVAEYRKGGELRVATTPPRCLFGILPDQWQGAKLWSSWGDAVWASDGKVYTSTGDHDHPFGHGYVYEIDPAALTMRLVVDVNKALGLEDETSYAPGKIHAPIVDGGDGWLYFAAYRGSVRSTTSERHYRGDWLLRYHMRTRRVENLGIMVPHSSVPVLELHKPSGTLYGLAVYGKTMPEPANQFFAYSLGERRLTFTATSPCRMNRALFVSRDGKAYMSGQDGTLWCYDPDARRLRKTTARVPGDGILRAASREGSGGVAYGISKDGVVFEFRFADESVREITTVFPTGPQYTAVCRLDPSSRFLYYVPGSHGGSGTQGSAIVQLDVRTGQRKVLAFPHRQVLAERQYNLGGSFGIAISPDGARLFIHWNGGPAGQKKNEFGLNAVMLIDIPEAERRPSVTPSPPAADGEPDTCPLRFEDVTEKVGLATYLKDWQLAHAAAWGDADGDGRADLFVGAFADRPLFGRPDAPIPNMLFLNRPAGFALSPEKAIRFEGKRARNSCTIFVDLDNDGDLDLFVATHAGKPERPNPGDGRTWHQGRLFENLGRGRYRDATPDRGSWPRPFAARNVSCLDFDRDGLLDLILGDGNYAHWRTGGGQLVVLRNRGHWTFEDISNELGFPAEGTVAMGLAVGDVNNDGRFDIFVADCNRLFVSRPDGTYQVRQDGYFRRPGRKRGHGPDPGHTCGADFGDLDGDGLLDLVTAVHGQPATMQVYLNRGSDGRRREGMPQFEDITSAIGLDWELPVQGITDQPVKLAHIALRDMDNDGHLDVVLPLLARGGPSPDGGGKGDLQPVVLRNLGVESGLPKFSQPPVERLIGYCAPAPVCDYDRDGRLDVFLASWFPYDKVPSVLFRNTTEGGHWLRVRVRGDGRGFNTMGIGAQVRAYEAGLSKVHTGTGEPASLICRRDIAVGTGYSSGQEAVAHLGLGEHRTCDLVVRWGGPGGLEEKRTCGVGADQNVTVAFGGR